MKSRADARGPLAPADRPGDVATRRSPQGRPGRRSLASLLALLLLAGCASSSGPAAPPDPVGPDETGLDRFNRGTSDFNHWVQLNVLVPVVRGYNWIIPKPLQTGIENVLINLQRPRDIVNSLLQGKLERAGRHTAALLINTTWGIGGLFYASPALIGDDSPETFNETLGVWGVPPGPYVNIPLVIPPFADASPRTLVGAAVDAATAPTFWLPFLIPGFGGWVSTGTSASVTAANGLNIIATLMPEPWADQSEWNAFYELVRSRSPYPERKALFYENQQLDVED